MINALDKAMEAGYSSNVLVELFDALKEYAAIHFSTEERLFDTYDFPEAEAHKDEHAKFILQVEAIETEFGNDVEDQTLKLLAFLVRWLFGHLRSTDQEYSEYLISRGA